MLDIALNTSMIWSEVTLGSGYCSSELFIQFFFMFKFLLMQIHDCHWPLTLHFHEYQLQTYWLTNTSTCLFMNWLDPVWQTLHWALTFKHLHLVLWSVLQGQGCGKEWGRWCRGVCRHCGAVMCVWMWLWGRRRNKVGESVGTKKM